MTTKTKIILTAQDRTKSAFRSANRSITGLERTVSRATAAFGVFIGAGAVGGLVKSIADAGLAMERFERGFRAATGSAQAGARELLFTTETAKRLGLDLESAAGSYAKLTAAAQGTAIAGQEARNIFTAVSEASVVLGLTAEQTEGALTAIEQIISKGKVSAEELRGQLGERLPGAFQIAARAIGVTTAELDDMLKKGELTAEDLLPKMARELRNTYGSEVQTAVNSAQAAIARFNTAIFELKNAIAQSGVLDALAAFAQGIANVINPSLREEATKVSDTINALTRQIRRLKEEDKPGSQGLIDSLQVKLKAAEDQMIALQLRLGELNTVGAPGGDGGGVSEVTEGMDAFIKSFETAEQKVARLTATLNTFKGQLDPAEFQRISDAINDELIEGIEEIDLNKLPRLRVTAGEVMDDMSEYAKQAASNMQDAFADFLFDPFEDGVKGMVKSFIDAIRTMAANQLAANFFESTGITGFISGIFGGPMARGGPVAAGVPYLVGERGPELMIPGQSGQIVPNNKLGGGNISVVNHIDARGADEARIMRIMPGILEQNKMETIASIVKMQNEGRI